jgi:hypothetical protein
MDGAEEEPVTSTSARTQGGAARADDAKPPLTQKPMESKSMVPELIAHHAAPPSVAKVRPGRLFLGQLNRLAKAAASAA